MRFRMAVPSLNLTVLSGCVALLLGYIPPPSLAAPLYHIEQVRDGAYTGIYGFNDSFAPLLLTVSLSNSVNLASDRRWPASAVIPPRSNLRLAIVYPQDSRLVSHWQTMSQATLGDPGATPNQSFVYRLPFPEGTRFRIGQGYDRRTTHQSRESHYAVDFTVPTGTQILAVRDGVVVEVDLGNVYGGKDATLLSKANQVVVLHNDGSLATYAHLQPDAAFVREGQAVTAGQRLALSGNTGYSGGPHLHFSVTANSMQGEYSLPVFFANGNPPENFMFAKTGAEMAVNYTGRHSDQLVSGWVPEPNPASPRMPQLPMSMPGPASEQVPTPTARQPQQPLVVEQSGPSASVPAAIAPRATNQRARPGLPPEVALRLQSDLAKEAPPETVFDHLRQSLGRAADASNRLRAAVGLGPNPVSTLGTAAIDEDYGFRLTDLLWIVGVLVGTMLLLRGLKRNF